MHELCKLERLMFAVTVAACRLGLRGFCWHFCASRLLCSRTEAAGAGVQYQPLRHVDEDAEDEAAFSDDEAEAAFQAAQAGAPGFKDNDVAFAASLVAPDTPQVRHAWLGQDMHAGLPLCLKHALPARQRASALPVKMDPACGRASGTPAHAGAPGT